MINTMIFDFNGTMFFDGGIQKESWGEFLKEEFTCTMTESEFEKHVAGRNNRDTLEYYSGRKISDAELEVLTNKKEQIYCDMCLSRPREFHLVDGLTDFLSVCLKNGIKLNIATASERSNVEFFFKHLDLEKWFDIESVSLNDGTLPGKPAPDMFLRAMENVDSNPYNSAIFEDSVSGIQAANNANAGKVILVKDPDLDVVNMPANLRTDEVIHDYSHVGETLMKRK
ncbi:HAD family hydrolase [Lactiplantibacillus plantarum]|uniref:HAD family hydrolase n=1 Tax=Lactiplantibacillus plantarum TaxID=1590 RepID=UPI001F4CBDC3|nr:HAD family hydrolase [Lactiplantibacillus plantarum]MCH8625476.1 HAD family hydrolase [Lactiplantibacillus plantarum]MCH8633401.1 HAD family hydrolase [Lactiplantibacillus plantarum]